jgi:adenine C2-methylase RlmN of 23S rRNA A2503 and tRNA A37
MTMNAMVETLTKPPLSLPAYRVRQLSEWIYSHGETDFLRMDSFPRALREKLGLYYTVEWGKEVEVKKAKDGTRKMMIGFQSKKSRMMVGVPVKAPTAAAAIDASASAPFSGDPSSSPSLLPSLSTSLFPTDHIECVYIPMRTLTGPSSSSSSSLSHPTETGSVCVSSQVGCSLTCSFCATGAMDKRKLRNLSTSEIVGQVMRMKHSLNDFKHKNATQIKAVQNVVFMGMGEPLLNYRNVKGAIDILTSHPRAGLGLGMGRPRITVSTSGIAPVLSQLHSDFEGRVSLAISLHAVRDELRDELVPINKQYPLKVLMEEVRKYQHVGKGGEWEEGEEGEDYLHSRASSSPSSPRLLSRRRVTFEYVMLLGINDSPSDALELSRLLIGISSLVNLIPFNPWEGSKYESTGRKGMEEFAKVLEEQGVPVTIRWPRGRDIDGACGQLAIKHERERETRWGNTAQV